VHLVALPPLALALLIAGATPSLAQSDTSTATIEAPTPAPSPTAEQYPNCHVWAGPTVDLLTPSIRSGETGVLRVTGNTDDYIYVSEKQAQDSQQRLIFSVHFTEQRQTRYIAVTPRTNAVYPYRTAGGGPERDKAEYGEGSNCHTAYYDGGAQEGSYSPARLPRIAVASVLRLEGATRTGARTYTFRGTNRGHAGDTVKLYRFDATGNEILQAQAQTRTDGTYRIGRTFTGTGTSAFVVKTTSDTANAAGESNRMRVVIR
jgi:hypothetical protein